MFNTRCGCLTCKGQTIPVTRWGWKALRNRHGGLYGVCRKPAAKAGAIKRKA